MPIEVTIEATNEVVSEDAVLENTPKDLDRQSCRLTSASTPVVCTYNAKHADWPYHAIARVVDARGRANTTDFFIPWWYVPPDDEPSLRIVAPDKLYRPGDIAKLEVRSDVVPAAAIVSYSRQGVFAQRRVVLDKPSTIIEVPIEATYMRDVHVIVDRVSSSKLEREYPEQRHAETRLELDPDFARLSVTARAQPRLLEPGGKEIPRRADGSYHVALGTTVRLDLEVITTARRHAVALADPLPAGFEVERGKDAETIDAGWDHVNLRDDRGEAFAMELAAGTHHFSYVVRAITPGTFNAAPPKAEEMYAPETFGRGTSATVVIE